MRLSQYFHLHLSINTYIIAQIELKETKHAGRSVNRLTVECILKNLHRARNKARRWNVRSQSAG